MASVDCINSINFNIDMLAENVNGDKKIKFSPNSFEMIKSFFYDKGIEEKNEVTTEVVNTDVVNNNDNFTLIGSKPLKVKEDWIFTTNNRYLLNSELAVCNFVDVNNKVNVDNSLDNIVAAVPESHVVPITSADVLPVVEEVNIDDTLFKVSPISGKAKIERYEEVATVNDSFDSIETNVEEVIPVVVPDIINAVEEKVNNMLEEKDIVNVVPIREEVVVSYESNDDSNVLELKEKLSMIKSEEEEQIRKNEEVMAQAENARVLREKLEKDVKEALDKKALEIAEKRRVEQEVLEELKKEQEAAQELEALLANI